MLSWICFLVAVWHDFSERASKGGAARVGRPAPVGLSPLQFAAEIAFGLRERFPVDAAHAEAAPLVRGESRRRPDREMALAA